MEGQEVYLLARLKGLVVILIALLVAYVAIKTKSKKLHHIVEKIVSLAERYPFITISNIFFLCLAMFMVVITFFYA